MSPRFEALRWRVTKGDLRRLAQSTYVDADLSPFEDALAMAAAANGVNTGRIAAALRGIDCPEATGPCFLVPSTASGRRPGAKRIDYPPERVDYIACVPVVDGLQMLVDLAADLDDLQWEQALESTLFRGYVGLPAIAAALPELSRART